MPFSRRPKHKDQTRAVSVADNDINSTTAVAADNTDIANHDDNAGDEKKEAAKSASLDNGRAKQHTDADADAPMPNHAPPGSGFGKLGDDDYDVRDVDSSASRDIPAAGAPRGLGAADDNSSVLEGSTIEYRTYKRRWFGLAQLTLLNIIVSWD
ncbi:hypothetical protein CH063_08447, partial [Colletotrichum higginsianum]